MSRVLALTLVVGCLAACSTDHDSNDDLTRNDDFTIPVSLTRAEVEGVIFRAAQAIDAPDLIVAVVDRTGNILGVWKRNPAATLEDCNKTVAIARAAAFLSSSQGPLSSRTLEFISTFHFPATFGRIEEVQGGAFPTLVPQRLTTGVKNTAQGPLWQIFTSNRGALIGLEPVVDAGAELTAAETGVETFYNGDGVPDRFNDVNEKYVPPARTIQGTSPGPGFGYLPGGVPLYKAGITPGSVDPNDPTPDADTDDERTTPIVLDTDGDGIGDLDCDPTSVTFDPALCLGAPRVVGGVGCFGAAPNACEFAAGAGAGPLAFPPLIPSSGGIFLVGILLPYLGQTVRPAGFNPVIPSDFVPTDATRVVVAFPTTPGLTSPVNRPPDPFGYLIGPRADPLGFLTQADVERIIEQGVDTARDTRAAIRLPLGTTVKMFFTVCNRDGLILALFRMQDAPMFSLDVSVAKARTVVYYSRPDLLDQFDEIPGIPRGTAITTRTLGFCSQPHYPPTIDGNKDPGPLFDVALENQNPAQFNRLGRAPFLDGLQNGLNFFPGSLPLYRNGQLVGGLAVSGDGVEQDDFVTVGAAAGFAAPGSIRADRFSFQGVQLPYTKFPQLPGRGRGPTNEPP